MFPTNMRSGFSPVKEPAKPNQELLDYLNNLLLVFTEKSIYFGAHYAKCAGRDNLSGMDTLYALQYLSHEFLNLPDLQECMNEDDSEISESESDSDSDSECEEEELATDDDADIFTRASDDDPICAKMNKYHDEWDIWNPVDDIQILLKQNVDKTIQKLS